MNFSTNEKDSARDNFIYDAFIDYQNTEPDRTIARKVYRVLKNYKAPHHIKRTGDKRFIKGIFMEMEGFVDTDDIGDDVKEALKCSKYMIVICSPQTLNSRRTLEKIRIYRETERGKGILTLLIKGEPAESFPILLREVKKKIWSDEAGGYIEKIEQVEPLAGDIRANNLKQSLKLLKNEKLRLIAPILGKSFDELKQRHRERTIRKILMVSSGIILATLIFGLFGFFEWQYTGMQKRQAEIARDEATRRKNIAVQQTEMAKQAIVRIYLDVPKEFKDIPEALPIIDEILREDVKTIQGSDEVLKQIFESYPELKKKFGQSNNQ